MLNGELNEKDLDKVLGGISYEDALNMEFAKLQQELIKSDSAQEKSKIYMKMSKIQSEIEELENQKSNGRSRW